MTENIIATSQRRHALAGGKKGSQSRHAPSNFRNQSEPFCRSTSEKQS
jgi:hypothetical protein